MIVRRALPDFTMTSTNMPWRLSSSVRDRSSAMPSTPFIGVRISWLILARNSDFARSADSATERAVSSDALASLKRLWASEIRRSIGSKTRKPSRAANVTIIRATIISVYCSAP